MFASCDLQVINTFILTDKKNRAIKGKISFIAGMGALDLELDTLYVFL